MKIGIITNLYPPHTRGGAENVIVRTVGQLLALGHDVFVITGQPKRLGGEVTLDRSSTERVYRFYPQNLYFTLDDYKYPKVLRLFWHIIDTFSWKSAKAVRQILLDEHPDVVITHNLKGLGVNIPRAIREVNVPHIHVLHDLQLLYPSGLLLAGQEKLPFIVKPAYDVYQYLYRVRIGDPDMVLSPSEYLRQAYLDAGYFKHAEVRVLRNPPPAQSAPRPPRRSPGPLRIFFVGQLADHKGIAFLLQAYKRMTMERSLLIVGDGPLRPVVEKAVEQDKSIRYLGYMPPGELSKFFSVVDAVVVPSLCYENSPTVIYEALNAGLPVVASRIGGVGELVQEGVSGYLFTPGDTTDLLRAMTELDANKDSLIASGETIRATVADFALDKYADRLIEIVREIIQRRGLERLDAQK
ncbi:MAG TPA: glycosyltransferase [bacterium]|nr:glycosyltransferase [bacterium]